MADEIQTVVPLTTTSSNQNNNDNKTIDITEINLPQKFDNIDNINKSDPLHKLITQINNTQTKSVESIKDSNAITNLGKLIQTKLKRKKKISNNNNNNMTTTTISTVTTATTSNNSNTASNNSNSISSSNNNNEITNSILIDDDVLNKKQRKTKTGDNQNYNNSICDISKDVKMIDDKNTKNESSTYIITTSTATTDIECKIASVVTSAANTIIVSTKPPLPPSKIPVNKQMPVSASLDLSLTKVPPPRLKRKLDEQNSSLVQKLNACTEQLRLEITDLKTALGNERNAVRMLRAQYEAESRKSKMEIKKLQAALETSKKIVITTIASNNKKIKEDLNIKDLGSGEYNTKLTQEILALKEANKILEEKIQIINEAERRKTADIRELKDSYEIRLTQISKSAKIEIGRLLEEIKTKERNIGQLKKEINSLKNATTINKSKDIKRVAQHPTEMKKLKDIERINSSNNTNQKCNTTTCGINDFHDVPHEINERILEPHTDIHIYRNKDAINSSDTDSALSSAPQSISPQPPPNGIMDSSDIWQSVKNYSKEIDTLQKNNELLQKDNEILKKELDTAKLKIAELEKTVLEANNNNKIQQLTERIKYLEQKENTLIKESYELREQNELLEFRILELEESHEKWSLRSNSNPDTRDMWTDTDQKSDDILMYTSDHTDSGVTSPHSQHHIDDRNVISPISLVDHASNEEIKRRLTEITKRPYIVDEDKLCLLQVLTLINNLEALSEDTILVNDEMISLDLTKSKASDYGSDSSSPRSILTDQHHSLQNKVPKISNSSSVNSKIIATVPPYNSTLSTPTDSPKKLRSWNSTSLQESGVFEGDNLDSICYTQSTQTEPEDFISYSGTTQTIDICAEIQKLSRYREKIEDYATTKSTFILPKIHPIVHPGILSPNLSDQRKLQYYKDRLELLENKLIIYESSGDVQAKRLAERLQREVKLEAIVKELRQKVESLESENLRLEEEKCEFEEAENDTRLRLQRLEIDLEILNQRNLELEMSREAVQNKLKDARNQCSVLQEAMKQEQEKAQTLEEDTKDLKNRLNLIKTSMPAILLFNSLMINSNKSKLYTDAENSSLIAKKCLCNDYTVRDQYLENKVQELMTREKELTQSITELNRAYHETLENADNLWVQIEKEYKDRLEIGEATENQLKMKIMQLEERLNYNSQCAQERITQLEESEQSLQYRITKLIKENKDLALEYENAIKESATLKDELTNLKDFIAGPIQENLDKEKQRVRSLEEDLTISNNLLSEMERTYRNELQSLKSQLNHANKELLHIEVTNSELKEEVTTLEKEIIDLQNQRCIDDEKIRNLADELRTKEEMLIHVKPIRSRCCIGPSLAQELHSDSMVCSMVSSEDENMVNELDSVQRKLKNALNKAEKRPNCATQCENLMILGHI